jgi:hypothetical protein
MAALRSHKGYLESRPVSVSSGWDDNEVEDINLHKPSFGVFVSVQLHPKISVLKYAEVPGLHRCEFCWILLHEAPQNLMALARFYPYA